MWDGLVKWEGKEIHISDISEVDLFEVLTKNGQDNVSREEIETLRSALLVMFWRFSTLNPQLKSAIKDGDSETLKEIYGI